MPQTRRARLARQLAASTALSYQQALAALDAHTAAGHPLPRTPDELAALTAAGPTTTTTDASAGVRRPIAAAEVLALLDALRPGTKVVSTWPAHPGLPGPHIRIVTAVHRPGDPGVPEQVESDEAALEMSLPDGPGTVWMSLPTTAADKPERWTLREAGDGQVELTYYEHTGAVSATYTFEVATVVPAVTEVVPVRIFTIRSSDVGRCPHLVMSVPHYLPSGACAHAAPTCPTCAGTGLLRDAANRPVPCAAQRGLAPSVPVCDGTGIWTGARTR